MKFEVHTLITETTAGNWETQIIGFDSIRKAFPTSRIHVTCNYPMNPDKRGEILKLCHNIDAFIHNSTTEHFEFIEDYVRVANSPTVITDMDQIFFDNMEELEYKAGLNGYHVPWHNNDYSRCLYASRLHTSLWVIPDPVALIAQTKLADPLRDKRVMSDYTYVPQDLFRPKLIYRCGEVAWYDTGASLYHAVGGTPFNDTHLRCFFHLNNASFYKDAVARFEGEAKSSFIKLHTKLHLDHDLLRDQGWKWINKYYADRAVTVC